MIGNLSQLRRSGHSSSRVGQVVAGASQCTVGGLFAMLWRHSASLLLDTAELEATITATTISAAVSSQTSVREQTGSTADEFSGMGSKDGLAVATVLETVEGVAAAAATAAINQWWVAGRSYGVDDTVARLLDSHRLPEGGSEGQKYGHK